MRARTRHDEAQAINNAKRQEREHWQGVVADKDTMIANKDSAIAEQAALIAKLQLQLKNQQ